MFSRLLSALIATPLLASAAPFTPSLETGFSNLVSRQNSAESSSPLLLDFPIHESCNASQRMQIERGLFDTKRLASAAAGHLLHHGNTSDLFLTYFGRGADPAIPIGYFERILEGDKTGTLFRCDDPDQNCATQDEWNGHWRGENATGETVICDLSFTTRKPIETMCSHGFSLANDNVNVYWGTDLMHRTFHLPSISSEHITHVADEYQGILDLALEHPEQSVSNQHTLQDFAFEVFTRENIDERGCVGEISEAVVVEDQPAANATANATPDQTTDTNVNATPEASSTAGKDCHYHGTELHCV